MAPGERPAGASRPRPTVYRLPEPLRWPRTVSWLIAVAAAALTIGASVVGNDGPLSPGSLSSGHGPIDDRCVQCHDPVRRVFDLRCERCHDPAGRGRMEHAAHVGTVARGGADRTRGVTCLTCHTDHRGTAFRPARIADDRCRRCHEIARFERHPEFAIVRARERPTAGLKFTHDRHIAELAKTGRRCEACHEATADERAFAPLSFARHCAACHVKDGALAEKTDPIAADSLLAIDDRVTGARLVPGARGLVEAVQLAHRDPWVMRNIARLAAAADPDGALLRRTALIRSELALERQLLPPTPHGSLQDVRAEAAQVDAEIVSLEAWRRDPAGGAAARERLLGDLERSAKELAGRIGGSRPTPGEPPIASSTAQPPVASTEGPAVGRPDARHQLLLDLLASIAARRPDLASKVAQLRTAVEQLPAPREPNAAELGDRLADLDALIARLGAITGPSGGAAGLDLLRLQRDASRQAISRGAASLGALERRQWRLISALDTILAQGGEDLTARATELRRQLLERATAPDGDGSSRLRDRQRLRERLRLEIELRSAGEAETRSATPPPSDRVRLEEAAARLKRQLDDEDMPAAHIDSRLAANSLDALVVPCLKCHERSGSGSLAAVEAPPVAFLQSTFNHAPHVLHADCLGCHRTIRDSHTARDVNIPGVATCRSCHAPARGREDCVTCHRYHPAGPTTSASIPQLPAIGP
jgi:hypothetical protein